LAEFSQLSRDADFAPGQVVSSLQQQPSAGPGVIGRRSMSDLGAIGDNLSPVLGGVNAAVQHDQLFNSQALEAAYRNLPLPKDSERPRSYIPVHFCSLFCASLVPALYFGFLVERPLSVKTMMLFDLSHPPSFLS
jgi:hypothetical protein